MSQNSDHKQKLFSEFPPVSEKQWREQVVKDLKGREFDKLIWKTYEDINIKPFYTQDDLAPLESQLKSKPGEFPFVRGVSSHNNNWKINQEILQPDIGLANKLTKSCLNSGADSVSFVCKNDSYEYLGIYIESNDDMSRLLEGIEIENAPIHFQSGNNSLGILSLYINEAKRRGIDLEKLSGSFDCDPLRDLSLNGLFSVGEEKCFNDLRELILYLNDFMPGFKALKVNSSQFHNSGAFITQELALTLSSGVEYLHRLTEMDLSVDDISKYMAFSFSIGSNYFMEIAKLRAARMLWAQIVQQYEPKNEASKLMHIEVKNSSWNKTQYDPFVNMLRGTVETMAGALGGAGTITVRPFDSNYKTPDEFSLRMSRNTQLVLKNESYLERVADPSAGSYYIETLTNSIAAESWKLFQEIEAHGGFVESLKSGAIQDSIEKTRMIRDINIATRKDTVLGVNQYPNSSETILSDIQEKRPNSNIENSDKTDSQIEVLQPYRGAQAFEDLRLATERNFERTGNKPKVFLLTIGNPSMRTARASFSSNFFGCAGFEIINNIGFDTPEDGVKAAIENKANIVVICSSDDEYPDFAPNIINQLKEQKADIKTIIAGNPKEHIKKLEQAGVDDFIHVRSNALEMLKEYQEVLGIVA